jgi:hypothetical protein
MIQAIQLKRRMGPLCLDFGRRCRHGLSLARLVVLREMVLNQRHPAIDLGGRRCGPSDRYGHCSAPRQPKGLIDQGDHEQTEPDHGALRQFCRLP